MKKWLLTLGLFLLCAGHAAAERIWIGTDLHISADGTIQTEALEALLEKPGDGDVLILMGDLANSGHAGEHSTVTEALGQMTGRAAVFVLPGNHDLTSETPPERFRELYHAYGYDLAFAEDPDSLSYAALTPAGVCLLMLDTNAWNAEKRTVSRGRIRNGLGGWIQSVLRQLPEETPVLVCGHHPLYPFEGTDVTENAQEAVQVLETGNVLAYLCGHRHSNDTEMVGHIRQIMVGVPWSYPAYLGRIERSEDTWIYTVEPVFDPASETYLGLKAASFELAAHMAEGSLKGTSYEGDTEAVAWFMRFFTAVLDGTVSQTADLLRAEPGYERWCRAEVRSAVKPWIISELESSGHEDYHIIVLDQK